MDGPVVMNLHPWPYTSCKGNNPSVAIPFSNV
jgi:hypothetical protein